MNGLTAKRLVKDFPDPKSKDSDLGLDKPSAVISFFEDAVLKEEKKEEKKEATKDALKDGEKKKEAEKKEEKKDPDAKPSLKTDKKDKPAAKLTFGNKDVNRGIVYVRRQVGDDVTLLAVQDSVLPVVSRGPLAYREKTLPALEGEPDKLTLVRADGTFELEKEKKDGKETWKLKQPKELAGRGANVGRVQDVLSQLHFLQAVELAAEKPSDADLDQK